MSKDSEYRELARELRELADWAWRESDRMILLGAAAKYDGRALGKSTPPSGEQPS